MKKINYRRYRIYKILIVIVLAVVVGLFVGEGNFIVPLIAFILALLIVNVLSKKVNARLTDERLDAVAGRASRIVLSTSVLLMAAAGIVLTALRNENPVYSVLGYTLLLIECGTMILYTILFKYYSKKG